jgi:hypothetical protein
MPLLYWQSPCVAGKATFVNDTAIRPSSLTAAFSPCERLASPTHPRPVHPPTASPDPRRVHLPPRRLAGSQFPKHHNGRQPAHALPKATSLRAHSPTTTPVELRVRHTPPPSPAIAFAHLRSPSSSTGNPALGSFTSSPSKNSHPHAKANPSPNALPHNNHAYYHPAIAFADDSIRTNAARIQSSTRTPLSTHPAPVRTPQANTLTPPPTRTPLLAPRAVSSRDSARQDKTPTHG